MKFGLRVANKTVILRPEGPKDLRFFGLRPQNDVLLLGALKLFLTLLAVTFLIGIPRADAASYLEEQAVDQELGLLDEPWKINLVDLHTPADLPPQMALGLPPYDQQVEKAQVAEGTTTAGTSRRA